MFNRGKSYPIRDAWIEISTNTEIRKRGASHPIRDVWIEIR